MKSYKVPHKEAIAVKVKMKAFSQGYYAGRVIQPGEEFLYEGNLNGADELPLWAESVDEKFDLAKVKADHAKKKTAKAAPKEAPKKDEEVKVDATVSAPSLPPLTV